MLFTLFHLIFLLGINYLIGRDKIATGSFDQTAKVFSYNEQLWNTKDGSMLYTFRGHIAEIVCLSFDPMSTYLVTGSMDKTSILWNVETGQAVMQIDVLE